MSIRSAYDRLFEVHDGRSKLDGLLHFSLRKAIRQQGLAPTYARLIEILPDISNQYTNPDGMNCMDPQSPDYVAFYADKVRAQHAFQIAFTARMIAQHARRQDLTLVDVGDSSGNHIRYLQGLEADYGFHLSRAISVNLDTAAIEKVKQSGGEAILCRAEALHTLGIQADVLVSYEMLEHLASPVDFLYQLSQHPPTEFALFTVPFLRTSRMGLHHIRLDIADSTADPEDVHLYELCPEDWKLMAQHCGWECIDEMIFYQYPTNVFGKMLRPIWRKYEYEGFYGFVLKPNAKWKSLYSGW